MDAESERDRLREDLRKAKESTDQAEVEKADAITRAKDLEARLETLQKDSQAALKKSQDEAEEREKATRAQTAERAEQIVTRLRALAESFSSALRAPLDTAGRLHTNALADAVKLVEEQGVKATEVIAKAATALSSFHRSLFPDAPLPGSIDGYVKAFNATSLDAYNQEQILRGARAAVTFAMAGGVQGDYEKAFSGLSKDADGKEAGAADSLVALQQEVDQPRERSTGSVPSDPVFGPSQRDGESYVLSSLRTRCEEADQQLKVVQATVDVAKSKQRLAAEREEFLMGELRKTAKDLLCKYLRSPRVSCSALSDFL